MKSKNGMPPTVWNMENFQEGFYIFHVNEVFWQKNVTFAVM